MDIVGFSAEVKGRGLDIAGFSAEVRGMRNGHSWVQC